MLDKTIQIKKEKEFSFLHFIRTEKTKVFLIIIAAFLFAFSSTSILTKASTIPTGLSAISMTSSFIFPVLKPYLNFIYLGLNIPLFIIFWNKVKKSYLYLTLLFLITSAVFGFFIGFDFGTLINGKQMSLDYLVNQYIFIFCPPSNAYEHIYAEEYGLNNLMTVRLNDYYEWLKTQDFNLDNPNHSLKYENTGITIGVEKGWPIFVYMLVGVILCASSAAISWKCGSSTGGTDVIAYYFSTKKKKSVGGLLTIIGFIIVSFSLLIVWLLANFAPTSMKRNINGFEGFFGLQSLSSFVYVILYGKILNMLYPKYKKVLIRIDTTKVDVVKAFLDETGFRHAYKIHTITSGRTGQNIYTFETIVLLLESEEIIQKIKEADPTAWISKLDVKKTYGRFDYSYVE